MATNPKRLFASRPSATTNTELYGVGADDGATINMSICNTGADTTFRLALTAGSAPVSGEYVFYDLPIASNETRQITGICLGATQTIWVYSGAATIDYVGTGIEDANSNPVGFENVSVGREALFSNTTGHSNVASGYQSLYSNTTGSSNVASGREALSSNTTGNYNSSLGRSSGNIITTGDYNTSLGYNAQPSTATVSGEFTLGDANVTTLRCNDTTISSLSDARDKTDVVPSPYGLDFLNTLNPVQYKWDTREGNVKDGSTRLGFIAQDLLAAGDNDITDLVHTENPERLEAKYGNLIPIMTKAIQELSAKVEQLEQQLGKV